MSEPTGWNIRRRNGGLLVTGPGGMTTLVDGSLEAGGITGVVLHALASDLLTATPPASIPASEVQALVERLREQANESDRIADTFDDPERRNWYQGRAEGYEAAADNLALLIPRNPE